jgi:hypothetical protein
VGEFVRLYQVDSSDNLYVQHDYLELDSSVRGGGFASRWNRQMEAFYRANGVDRIQLHADITVGGYAWAKQGYQFATDDDLGDVAERFRARLDTLDTLRQDLEEYETARADLLARGDQAGADRLDRMYQDDPSPDAARAEIAAIERVLEYATPDDYEEGTAPTPLDFAMVGWVPGAETWPGKQQMVGSDWYGVKYL